VAYALQWFTPARDDEMALTWHHFQTVPDRASRGRAFLEAYGGLPAFDVAEAIPRRMEVTRVAGRSCGSRSRPPTTKGLHD
jgi:hypothetical protein